MRLVLALAATLVLCVSPSGGDAFRVVQVDVADAPQRLDAADLDGDGDVDLCVLAQAPGNTTSLQVLLNDGGHFTPGWSVVENTASFGKYDIDLADSDNDGDTDVIYVLPSYSPRERFNDGAGHFDARGGLVPTFSLRFEHEVADMNGDGNVDVVHYDEDIFFCAEFGTLLGFGNGNFAYDDGSLLLLYPVSQTLARRFTLGDATGDGLRDGVMASNETGLRLVQGLPPVAPSTLPGWLVPLPFYPVGCDDVALADLDGNGLLDIVATVPSLASVVVFYTRPGGQVGKPHLFPAGTSPSAIVAADFDLDGFADVIVTDPATGSANFLRGSDSGRLQAPEEIPVGAGPTDLVTADLDGDGDLDLAVTCGAAGQVTLLFNRSL